MISEKEFGELLGKVSSIKENTDKMPELLAKVAIHESLIKDMKPKVDDHERTTQRAFGIAALTGLLTSLATSWYKAH